MFTLKEKLGGEISQLDVRRGPNHELVLSLGRESIDRLQDTERAPAFCRATDDETVDVVAEWLRQACSREVIKTETPLLAVRHAHPDNTPSMSSIWLMVFLAGAFGATYAYVFNDGLGLPLWMFVAALALILVIMVRSFSRSGQQSPV